MISYRKVVSAGRDTGPGFVWLYNTADWSCQKLQQELLEPPVACTLDDTADLNQGIQLLVAPGPASALLHLTVPALSQVSFHVTCQSLQENV